MALPETRNKTYAQGDPVRSVDLNDFQDWISYFHKHRPPFFSVKTYGAKGDGAANDTAAVQLALDAAVAAGGGEVYVPQGIYLCSGLVINADLVRLVGLGDGSILRRNVAGTLLRVLGDRCLVEGLAMEANGLLGTMIRLNVDGVATTQLAGFTARDLRLICDHRNAPGVFAGWHRDLVIDDCYLENLLAEATDTTTGGIILHSGDDQVSDDDKIRGNTVVGFRHGIESYGTGTRRRALIEGNTVKQSVGTGIYAYHATQSRIVENAVDDCDGGIWSDSGSGAGPETGYGNEVHNNNVRHCTTYGLLTEQIIGGSIVGNTLVENRDGLVLGGGNGASTISGNNCSFNTRYGIWLDRFQNPVNDYEFDLTLVGNTVKCNGEDGVRLGSARKSTTLVGNTITDNGTSASDLATSPYAGVWIGRDTGATTTVGAVHLVGNTIGCNIVPLTGDGPTGKQGFGVWCEQAVISRVVVVANHMDGHGQWDIYSNYNNIDYYANHLSKGVSLSNTVQRSFGNFGAGANFATISQRSAAPTTGTWKVGDIVFNSAATPGEPTGWFCTVAGSPGTWLPFGIVPADPAITIKSANYNVTALDQVLICVGGGSGVIFTLPASPTTGQRLEVHNHNSSFALVVNTNGQLVNKVTGNVSIAAAEGALFYYVSGQGWFAKKLGAVDLA